MANLQILKQNLNKITKATIRQAIYLVIESGIDHIAPLGYSSTHVRIYGSCEIGGRSSIFEIRNHSGMISTLITDLEGNFLINNKYCPDLGFEIIVSKIYDDFKTVKKYIDITIESFPLSKFINHIHKKVNPNYGYKSILKKQLIFKSLKNQ